MKFIIQTPEEYRPDDRDCMVIGISEKGELTEHPNELSKITLNYLKKFFETGEILGKIGQTLLLFNVPETNTRILLVGCGNLKELKPGHFRSIIASSIKALITSKTKQATSFLLTLPIQNTDLAWKVKQATFLCYDNLYIFDSYKSVKEPQIALQKMCFVIDETKNLKTYQHLITESLIIAKSVEYTKNLSNQPSNICTPNYLAEQAKKLAKEYKNITVKILEENALKKLGMGALLSVGKGSEESPKLICLEYKGTSKKISPIALVGKGITFDTGGVSLKPADAMVGMKYDMCGAASVLGTFKAISDLKLPLHLIGIIPVAENMPSGSAYKPEDIITTLSGQTVEVMNTDAEGRLILADALTYCERYKPKTVIDIATLTGAVVIALGTHATGLLANNEELAKNLLAAGNESFDRAWQLPLWEEYQEQLKSPFADMSNVGGRTAGVITAACFLSRFTKKFQWAHLDVAGTAAMMFGNDRYATGRPVPLLVQYLMDQSKNKG